MASWIAGKSLFPAGLPYDSPASMPATATPAARNRSNIHRSSGPGRFGSVGAYHTHGFAAAYGSAFAGMRNAVRPDTSNTSPSRGSDFFGGSAIGVPSADSTNAIESTGFMTSPPDRRVAIPLRRPEISGK